MKNLEGWIQAIGDIFRPRIFSSIMAVVEKFSMLLLFHPT